MSLGFKEAVKGGVSLGQVLIRRRLDSRTTVAVKPCVERQAIPPQPAVNNYPAFR